MALGKGNERTDIKVAAEKAVLAALHLPEMEIDEADPLGELRALAETAGAEVVGEVIQKKQRPEAGTFIGSGKVEELQRICEATGARVVIFDNDLSPAQITNIQEAVGRKIVDRSELILDIFAGRATTHEAKLQVELAQLEYTYPRLRAMWDHLERIVGGAGGMAGIGTRGPGEQQLEIDRRLVRNRLTQLRRELEELQARKRREVQKRRQDHFTVGLVGYTNAGKSTLFNALTEGGAYAADKLFATLMTRTREWDLGDGLRVMLSDTVGFVRDLPHDLVASFKATLEEATHADVLLIVLDVADPNAERQLAVVHRTLDELFEDVRKTERKHAKKASDRGAAGELREWKEPARVLILNKVDALKDNAELLVWQAKDPSAIPLVAPDLTHPGHAALRDRVRLLAQGEIRERLITVPTTDGRSVHLLETRGEVLDREYENGAVTLRMRIGARELDRIRAGGARLKVVDVDG
jgi:GTP-binding protein HflX